MSGFAATRAARGHGDRCQRTGEEAEQAGALIRQLIERVSGRHDRDAG